MAKDLCQCGNVCPPPVQLPLPGSRLEPDRQSNVVADQPVKQSVNRALLIEFIEDQSHYFPRLLVGIEIHFPCGQPQVSRGHAEKQLAPLCLEVSTSLQTVTHDVQFHLAHD